MAVTTEAAKDIYNELKKKVKARGAYHPKNNPPGIKYIAVGVDEKGTTQGSQSEVHRLNGVDIMSVCVCIIHIKLILALCVAINRHFASMAVHLRASVPFGRSETTNECFPTRSGTRC